MSNARSILTITFALTSAMAITGCQNSDSEPAAGRNTSTASGEHGGVVGSNSATSKGDVGRPSERNTSTPKRGYVGHWENNYDGEITNDYVSPDGTMTRVGSCGTIIEFKWSVTIQNVKQRTLDVRLVNAGNETLGSSRTLTFAPNYMSYNISDTDVWTYVDAKHNP